MVMQGRNVQMQGFGLAAAGATSTIEVFDGEIGVVDATGDVSVSAGGSGYQVGDLLTITPANGGTPAVFQVATLSTTAVATVTLVTAGSGFTVGATHATTTNGAGTNATLDIGTADDTLAESIGKISQTANLSDHVPVCVQTNRGLSARVTGASAKGYVYHN